MASEPEGTQNETQKDPKTSEVPENTRKVVNLFAPQAEFTLQMPPAYHDLARTLRNIADNIESGLMPDITYGAMVFGTPGTPEVHVYSCGPDSDTGVVPAALAYAAQITMHGTFSLPEPRDDEDFE